MTTDNKIQLDRQITYTDEPKSIPEAIWEYASSKSNDYEKSDYSLWIPDGKYQPDESLLKKFLDASMDNVRLKYADKYATQVMEINNYGKANYFRKAVLRRELSSDISYSKQRDHHAHTLHNYLFGWYIFSNSRKYREEIIKHILKRYPEEKYLDNVALASPLSQGDQSYESMTEEQKTSLWKDISHRSALAQDFAFLWLFCSLVHDIGYLFEGSLTVLDTKVQNESVKRGASVVQDYFHHKFFHEININSLDIAERLLKLAEMKIPDFSHNSLAEVSENLRKIGNLDKLFDTVIKKLEKSVKQNELKILEESNKLRELEILKDKKLNESKKKLRELEILKDKKLNELEELTKLFSSYSLMDSFDLWEKHYCAYGLTSMAERITHIRNVYQSLVWGGLPKAGDVRMLDHGVCSGLLALQSSTFIYRLYFALEPLIDRLQHGNDPYNDIEELRNFEALKIFNQQVIEKIKSQGVAYRAESWWKKLVWATAACAIHNIEQIDKPWPGMEDTEETIDKLKLEDDPLAYLGILVDILEEWDRYTVSRESGIGGSFDSLPLQGRDVMLGISSDNKIVINYGADQKKRAEKVIKDLNKCLYGWNDLVEILAC